MFFGLSVDMVDVRIKVLVTCCHWVVHWRLSLSVEAAIKTAYYTVILQWDKIYVNKPLLHQYITLLYGCQGVYCSAQRNFSDAALPMLLLYCSTAALSAAAAAAAAAAVVTARNTKQQVSIARSRLLSSRQQYR